MPGACASAPLHRHQEGTQRSHTTRRPGAAQQQREEGAALGSGGLDKHDLQQQDELRKKQTQMSAGASLFLNEGLVMMNDLEASMQQMQTSEPLGWDAPFGHAGARDDFLKAEDLEEFGPQQSG